MEFSKKELKRLRIRNVYASPLAIEPWKDRWYIVNDDIFIDTVFTNGAVLQVTLKKGTKINARSGLKIVDLFVPHIGNKRWFAGVCCHDAMYYGFVKASIADRILREYGRISGQPGVVYNAIQPVLFLFGRGSYTKLGDELSEPFKYNRDNNLINVEFKMTTRDLPLEKLF